MKTLLPAVLLIASYATFGRDDQFEHTGKQVQTIYDRLRDISAEIAVIHRRVERLEEFGASNAGFAKEIDHLLMRVTEIEKHLGIDKKIAA